MSEAVFRKYHEKLLEQLSLDFNCAPTDLLAKENVLTTPALHAGRRSYSPGMPFLQMVTLGANAVIMADSCLHGLLRGWMSRMEGHRLFTLDSLIRLNGVLRPYGWRMAPTHHMFLPCRDVRVKARCEVKWLYDGEISPFYGDSRFPNAIAYPEPCPVRPDRIAAVALDGDAVMGMAGCSEDAPHWQQIGIDVLPAYRSRGIGSLLVALLKNRVIERGDIPFYGTDAANIRSQSVALGCGFRPAWVETEAVRITDGA